jgi:hypothetical protein
LIDWIIHWRMRWWRWAGMIGVVLVKVSGWQLKCGNKQDISSPSEARSIG